MAESKYGFKSTSRKGFFMDFSIGAPGRARELIINAPAEDVREVKRGNEIAKAEAEGRLVVLPCKVGDIVYAVFEEQGILSLTVERFLLSEKGLFIATPHGLYHTERFGKTVFLTREEAEKALEAKK